MGSSVVVLILLSSLCALAHGFWDGSGGKGSGYGSSKYNSYGGELSCYKCEQVINDMCSNTCAPSPCDPNPPSMECIDAGNQVCSDNNCVQGGHGQLSCSQCAEIVDDFCDTVDPLAKPACLARKITVCEENNCKDKYDSYGGSGYGPSKYNSYMGSGYGSSKYGSGGSYGREGSYGGGYGAGYGARNGYGSSEGSYAYGSGYGDNGHGDNGYGDNGYGDNSYVDNGYGDNSYGAGYGRGYGNYDSYKPYRESSGYTIGKRGGPMVYRSIYH